MPSQGTVLIASRDGGLLSMVQEICNDLGYMLVPAVSVDCAVDVFCGGKVRVTIIDDMLADGSGMDLLKRLRHIDPEAKAIYVTGAASEELERSVRAAGINYFVCKPVEASLFKRVLQKVIEHETRRLMRLGA